MRRWFPWIVAAIFALAFVILLISKHDQPRSTPDRTPDQTSGVTQDSSGKRVTAWVDPMYSQGPPHIFKSDHPGRAPDCNMALVPVYADESPTTTESSSPSTAPGGYANLTISPQRQQLIGVKLATAEFRDLSHTTRTTGRIAIDERSVVQIHAKFEGFVETLYANVTGAPVRRGDPLLAIYSPDLLATQNELLLAERNRSDLGHTLADAARARLRLWDMSAADIDRVVRSGTPVRAVPLRSPVSGIVMTKNVLAGARVMPSDTLYEIACLSHLWVLADIYESELPAVRIGDAAQVAVGGQTLTGHVTFIGSAVNAQSRTTSVRIELDNPGGQLKPDMFANVTLLQRGADVITVPDSAVMNTGTRSVLFVANGNGTFEPREVITGAKSGNFYEIRSGLQAGERVVVDANFLVDSESRLKSALSQMDAGGKGRTP